MSQPSPPPFDAETQAPVPRSDPTGKATLIGPYRLLERIGEGGMGDVWLAEQKAPVRRRVALKLIKPGMDSREVIARFESERQALALMDHFAIAKIFDAGSTPQGCPYFVMEFVPGLDICTYCDQHRLTMRERLNLFVMVCQGVQHAHRKAVIHRDLKPSNILVCEVDGKAIPKIIDFGVAKAISHRLTADTLLTRAGTVLGTPEYMSPEQCQSGGEDIDTRTDVFSLGVVLYELLIGQIPIDYRKLAFEEVLRAIRLQDPPRPSYKLRTTAIEKASLIGKNRRTEPGVLCRQLRGDLDAIALKALEKDRSRRYGGPSELAADISRYLEDQPVLARPASFLYRSKKAFLRNKFVALSASVLLLLLLFFSITEASQLKRITEERDRSDRTAQFMVGMFRVPHHGFGPGLSVTAGEILDKASRDVKSSYTADPVTQARLESALGAIFHDLGGSNARAETLVRDALRIQTKAKGAEDRETLRLTRTLADFTWSNSDSLKAAESERILRANLKTERRVMGSKDPETLKSILTLGVRSFHPEPESGGKNQGRESEMLLREALAGNRRILGAQDPETIMNMFYLSQVLTFEHKYEDAEEVARELVDAARKASPQEDDSLNMLLWNLANILDEEKKYPEAEGLLRELADRENRSPNEEKFLWFQGLRSLFQVLIHDGKYSEAETTGRHLLGLERNAFGPDHPRVARVIYGLACIAALSHQTDKAFSLLRNAVNHALPSEDIAAMKSDKQLEFIRSDPRFAALLASDHTIGGRAALR